MRHCQEQRDNRDGDTHQFYQLYLDGKLDNLDADILGGAPFDEYLPAAPTVTPG